MSVIVRHDALPLRDLSGAVRCTSLRTVWITDEMHDLLDEAVPLRVGTPLQRLRTFFARSVTEDSETNAIRVGS